MRSHTVRARLLLTVWIVLLIAPGVACNDVAPIDNNADKASENAALGGYTVPERSDDELSAALLDVCTEARDDAKPLLVEFSAPWCSDCRKLHQMKQDPALARELQRWATLTINVALFDRHREILDALRIEKIAHWSVFASTNCSAGIESWPRLHKRTLEPASGAEQALGPKNVANWLSQIRVGVATD